MAEQTWEDAADEVWRLFKETDAMFKETDAQFKETDVKIQSLTENINRLEGMFGNQWGRLIEAMVKPSVAAVLRERGIPVEFVDDRVTRHHNGQTIEFDLVLTDTDTLVIIETKSNLKTADVTNFIEKLGLLFEFFPLYRGFKVYAGVAALTIPGDVGRFAYRQGLFVLQVGGDGMVTLNNDDKFQPKDFGLLAD